MMINTDRHYFIVPHKKRPRLSGPISVIDRPHQRCVLVYVIAPFLEEGAIWGYCRSNLLTSSQVSFFPFSPSCLKKYLYWKDRSGGGE